MDLITTLKILSRAMYASFNIVFSECLPKISMLWCILVLIDIAKEIGELQSNYFGEQ